MKRASSNYAAMMTDRQSTGELLILPDGRILVHNLTPPLARLLSELEPDNAAMRARAGLTPPAPAAPSPTSSAL